MYVHICSKEIVKPVFIFHVEDSCKNFRSFYSKDHKIGLPHRNLRGVT